MAKMMDSEFFSATFFHNLAEIESHVRRQMLGETEHKKHSWNEEDSSSLIKVQDNGITAKLMDSKSMQGVRSQLAYSNGIHFFEISWNPDTEGNVVIGLATKETELSGNPWIVGADDQSVGWNLSTKQIIYNSCVRKSYPKAKHFKVPARFTMVLNMERGTMSFKKDKEEFGVAHSGLMHIAKEFHIAAALEAKNASISLQYLGSSENLTMEGSILVEPLAFHNRCGKNARIAPGNRRAERTRPDDTYDYATVMSNRPLRNGEFFRVRLDKHSSESGQNSFQMGATTNSPESLKFIDHMLKCEEGKSWIFTGPKILHKGFMIEELNGDLRELMEGETAGVKVEKDKLQFYVNGYRQCTIPIEISEPLYGFVDIYGQASAISLIDGSYKVQESLAEAVSDKDGSALPKTIDEFVALLHSSISLMTRGQPDSVSEVQKLINKLFKVNRRGFTTNQRTIVADKLAQLGGGKVICGYLEKLRSWMDKSKEAGVCYQLLKDLCCNFCEDSFNLCKSFGEAGMIQDCVRDLKKLKPIYEANTQLHGLLKSTMGIIHNCTKVSENRPLIKQCDYLKIARAYVKPDQQLLWASLSTLLTLSYVCQEGEQQLLLTAKPVAASIVEHLKNALREDTRTHGGWSTVELVTGVSNLTELEENIAVFVNCGITKHLVKMLEVGSDHEIEHAADLVWKLMQDESKKAIMDTKGLSGQLQVMERSTNTFIKQAVTRIRTRYGLTITNMEATLENPPQCSYMQQCRLFLDSLKLSDYFFDSSHDRCYCINCHCKRGEKSRYTRGVPAKTYGVPVGWCRFGLAAPPKAKALEVFTKWHRAYHGTKKEYIKGILEVGEIVPAGRAVIGGEMIKEQPGHFTDDRKPSGFDTKQVFLSPSIRYSGVDAYARPSRFYDEEQGKNSDTIFVTKVALQVVIKPGSYLVGAETIGATAELDPSVRNEEMEWSTNQQGSLVLYGLLIKVD